jgi:hypothetical protein
VPAQIQLIGPSVVASDGTTLGDSAGGDVELIRAASDRQLASALARFDISLAAGFGCSSSNLLEHSSMRRAAAQLFRSTVSIVRSDTSSPAIRPRRTAAHPVVACSRRRRSSESTPRNSSVENLSARAAAFAALSPDARHTPRTPQHGCLQPSATSAHMPTPNPWGKRPHARPGWVQDQEYPCRDCRLVQICRCGHLLSLLIYGFDRG